MRMPLVNEYAIRYSSAARIRVDPRQVAVHARVRIGRAQRARHSERHQTDQLIADGQRAARVRTAHAQAIAGVRAHVRVQHVALEAVRLQAGAALRIGDDLRVQVQQLSGLALIRQIGVAPADDHGGTGGVVAARQRNRTRVRIAGNRRLRLHGGDVVAASVVVELGVVDQSGHLVVDAARVVHIGAGAHRERAVAHP